MLITTLLYIYIFIACYLVGVSCVRLDAPRNGRVNTSADIPFGNVARYSCDAGYTLNGAAERTCQADGEWDGTEPTCESKILESSNQPNICACHRVHSQFSAATMIIVRGCCREPLYCFEMAATMERTSEATSKGRAGFRSL